MVKRDLLFKSRQDTNSCAGCCGKKNYGNKCDKIDVEKGIDRTDFSVMVGMGLRQRNDAGITMETFFRFMGVKRNGKLKKEKG